MYTKNYDVVALGELLIDFIQNGLSPQNNILFEANPGGAPCNVLSMLNNLGKKTAFIGKVGKDSFGHLLKDTLDDIGIDTSGLKFDDKTPTTLAFVHNLQNGDRDFTFYRNPGADTMLLWDEVETDLIKEAKIFHFGTLSMTDDAIREVTKNAVDLAKKEGALISFDPNLRQSLWRSLIEAKEQIMYGISQCNILKISDEELEFVTGYQDIDRGINLLRKDNNVDLIAVTMGKNGSIAYYKDLKVYREANLQKFVLDATGAGDTFCGCMLYYIIENGIHDLTKEDLNQLLHIANKAAGLITQKKGALKVMPKKEEVLSS